MLFGKKSYCLHLDLKEILLKERHKTEESLTLIHDYQGWIILKTVTHPTSPNVSTAMVNLIINIGKNQNVYSSCNIRHSPWLVDFSCPDYIIHRDGILFLSIWAAAWQNQQNDLCAQQRIWSALASAKTLIRLGGCPGWSESSLGAKVILLFLSWGGSFVHVSINKIKKIKHSLLSVVYHQLLDSLIE